MANEQTYKTKQRQIILDYLTNTHEQHVTVSELCAHFKHIGINIGTATVYRHLEKFISDGIVRKYYIDGIPSACFQFINCHEDADSHVHFKCIQCGNLICIECDKLQDLKTHFSNEHGFQIDSVKTVFYGRCPECAEKNR